jgi:hypothetical protein
MCEQNNSKIVSKSHKMYGFWPRAATIGLWVMGYCGLMGFRAQIPIHRVGGMVLLWYLRGYGLSKVWFMRGSTVYSIRTTHSPFPFLFNFHPFAYLLTVISAVGTNGINREQPGPTSTVFGVKLIFGFWFPGPWGNRQTYLSLLANGVCVQSITDIPAQHKGLITVDNPSPRFQFLHSVNT